MNVLHVVPSFYPAHVYGGPIESVYALCCHLVAQNCRLRVLSTNANGLTDVLDVETGRELTLAGAVPVRYCHRLARHSISLEFLRCLPEYIRWADVVHLTAVYSFPTIPTLAACKVAGRPLIWSPRGALQRWPGTRKRGRKKIFEALCRAAAPAEFTLHVTSREEAEESALVFPNAKIAVVPNGVEIPSDQASAPKPSPLRLLYLGRLDAKKGIGNLLAACAQLNQTSRLAFSLTIAGEGDAAYEQILRQRIAHLSLAEQVEMVGAVHGVNKQQLLNATSVVIVPSFTENFAIVVAEALAHGVPVIASKGTPWSRVAEVGCGLWVDNDPTSLASAIERIANMPLAEMGQRGRRWMADEFAWDERAKSMLRVYRECLGVNAAVAPPIADHV